MTRWPLWEHTGSNRGPSACKADALNQLSYAPLNFRSANICLEFNFKKFKLSLVRISTGKRFEELNRCLIISIECLFQPQIWVKSGLRTKL